AREAERGQGAHEARRQRRNSAGGVPGRAAHRRRDLDPVTDTLTALIFYGFVALLVLLRFDAKRFGAADYDDEDANDWRGRARPPSWVRVFHRAGAGTSVVE